MKADVKVSTRFLSTQSAHQIGLLISAEGEMPSRRAPINLSLVLDRSGSMAGPKLDAARDAATRFASFLGADDRLSVVTFDDQVQTIYGPLPADPAAAAAAIRQVHEGGSTNLSGGWLQGRAHVGQHLVEGGTNRVVLFTDGLANIGITGGDQLRSLPRSAAQARVTTTCIGFGETFDEDLLRDMARAGQGNFWYIERVDQMAGIFAEEIEGLVALAAQNLRLSVRFTHPGAQGVSLLQDYPVTQQPDGSLDIAIGDLYAASPRVLGLAFHVANAHALGNTTVAEVKLSADVIKAGGVEHRVITMPVIANLDAADHPEPVVDVTFLRFEAARARDEAVRRADEGDFDTAAIILETAASHLEPHVADAIVAEEVADLSAEAKRMKRRRYDGADRKYHMVRSLSAREGRDGYADKISRRRPPRPS